MTAEANRRRLFAQRRKTGSDGRPEKKSGDLAVWELSHSILPPVNLVYRRRLPRSHIEKTIGGRVSEVFFFVQEKVSGPVMFWWA